MVSRGGRREAALLIAGFALLLAAVGATGKQTARERPKPAPQLLSVALYSSGLGSGRITLDCKASKLRVFEYSGNGTRWYVFEAAVPRKDGKALLALISKAGLHQFAPRAEWFAEYDVSKYGLREGGGDLVLTWSDRKVVLGIPPLEVRQRLPSGAKRTYESIDAIANRLLDIEHKCRRTASVRHIDDPVKSAEVDAFNAELDTIWAQSLPRNRKGW